MPRREGDDAWRLQTRERLDRLRLSFLIIAISR